MFPPPFLARARRRAVCAFVLAATGIAAPRAAAADDVARWNLRATIAAADAHLDPAAESTLLAVLHTAMFDAVNAVLRYSDSYNDGPSSLGGQAPAAVVSAAHVVLSTFLPSERTALDAALMQDLAAMPEGPSRDLGVAAGRQAADLVMARWAGAPRDAHPWGEVLELLAWGCDTGDDAGPHDQEIRPRPDETRTQAWNRRARVRAASRSLSLWENARFFAVLNRALAAGRGD